MTNSSNFVSSIISLILFVGNTDIIIDANSYEMVYHLEKKYAEIFKEEPG